jgi:AraC-like DNA-binding protein
MEWLKLVWKRRPNWSRTFYDYLFSYIMIVGIASTIVAAVVFTHVIPGIERDIKAGNLSLLTQVREAMDKRTQEMNRIALRISINPDLTPFVLGSGGYEYSKTLRLMEDYRSSNSFIYDLAIYYNFREDPNMYAASGTYTIDYFFDHKYNYSNWGKQDFLNEMNQLRMPVMRPLETVKLYGHGSKPMATYMYPLPINANKPYGVVVFLIDEEAFAGMFKNVLHTGVGHAFIFNDKEQLVAYSSAGSQKEDPKTMLEQLQVMSLNEGMHTIAAGSNEWSVVKMSSKVNGWTYVSAMPSDTIMKQVHANERLFLFTIIALLAVGTIASILLTLRHYRPLKVLADSIYSQNMIRSFNGKRDEISIIGHAVGEVSKENRGLQYIIKNQEGVMKEHVLRSLLRGKIASKTELSHAQNLASLPLDHPQFAVLMCLIDDYSRFTTMNTTFMQQILKYSLVNVLEELSLEWGRGYGMEWTEERGIVLVLNIRDGIGRDELEQLAVRVSEFYERHYRYSLTVGIGRIYIDSFMIHRSYVEAENAAKYRFLKGRGNILFYDRTVPKLEGEFWYPTLLESRLVMAIKQGNGEEVERTIQEMTDRITERAMSMETVEFICFDIINTVMKTMIEMGIQLKDYIDEGMESLFSPKYETMEELQQLVVHFCSKVCKYIKAQKESKNVQLYQHVLVYINEKYTEPSISLESIAELFGVSPSYLSRYFKDQTGYPLMRYIDGMRMDKAKELLKNSDTKLKDIIELVGYVDLTNFIRKFKRTEGMTPMQYRNIANDNSA